MGFDSAPSDFQAFFVENGIEDLQPVFVQKGISTLEILRHIDPDRELSDIVVNGRDAMRARYALLRLRETQQPTVFLESPNADGFPAAAAGNQAAPPAAPPAVAPPMDPYAPLPPLNISPYPPGGQYNHGQYAPPPMQQPYGGGYHGMQAPPPTAYPPASYQAAAQQQPIIVNVTNQQAQESEKAPLIQKHTVVMVDAPEENNCFFGCCMGWWFGLFGLCCLCCVRDKSSYLRGWAIPFIITLVAAGVCMGVFYSEVVALYNEALNSSS